MGKIKRYKDNNDGTITDNYTGLMWVKDGESVGCNSGKALTWKEAVSFCKKLNYADYDDWRLPDLEDLLSIADNTKYDLAIDVIFINTNGDFYWTSTTVTKKPTNAWTVLFTLGGLGVNKHKAASHYVRPVRGIMII